MKLNKSTYFALFFLINFLVSFGTNTYKNSQSIIPKLDLNHTKAISFSNKGANSISNPEFLYEEGENESENELQIQSFHLPFFISYFQYEVLQPISVSTKPLVEKLSNPIYISICNFRI